MLKNGVVKITETGRNVYSDDYEEEFTEYKDLLDRLVAMKQDTHAAAQDIKSFHFYVNDDNQLCYGNDFLPISTDAIRDFAIRQMASYIGLMGNRFFEVLEESKEDARDILNTLIKTHKKAWVIRIVEGKINSANSSQYAYIPACDVLKQTQSFFDTSAYDAEFKSGSVSYQRQTAKWIFHNALALEAFKDIELEMRTSDSGNSAVNYLLKAVNDKGRKFPLITGVSVTHKGKNKIDNVVTALEMLDAVIVNGQNNMIELDNYIPQNENTVYRVAKHAGLPASALKVQVEPGDTALQLYCKLCEAVDDPNLSENEKIKRENNLLKATVLDNWKTYDNNYHFSW